MDNSAKLIQNWWRSIRCCTSCRVYSKDLYAIVQDNYFCRTCFNNETYKTVLYLCYCKNWRCLHDCGSLICGCVDQCKGRCYRRKLFSN